MNPTSFFIAPAVAEDFDGIIALQDANHLSNLDAQVLEHGFVTTQLSPESLQRMAQNGGVWVARAESQVAAYICANDWAFYGENSFQQRVREALPLPFGADQSRLVRFEDSFQYGPACIALEFRGLGLAGALAAHVRAHYAPRFAFGVTFIDVRNARSLAAHERKLGFTRLTLLPTEHATYHMLAFATRASTRGAARFSVRAAC